LGGNRAWKTICDKQKGDEWMECPVCKKRSLRKHLLEAELPAYRCRHCEGIWISAAQYWKWLKTREDHPAQIAREEMPLPVEESAQAKLCPECGRILRRYKIWPNVEFYLDRCGHCMSVWFDKDEWVALRTRGAHDEVHLFFMDIWQDKLRAEESRQRMEKMYRERFGEEDYAKLRDIRAWLEQHPQHGALVAYLTDRDPYRPISR